MPIRINKKTIILLIFFFIVVIGFFIYSKNKISNDTTSYNQPTPEYVVRQYFIFWNNKDYANMYATISDGFKKIEPTAKNLVVFKEYVNSQIIEKISILSIKEKANDGTTATVDYLVEFVLTSGEIKKFDGTFTLKYRKGDIIPGWKLIHPYGDNIDTS